MSVIIKAYKEPVLIGDILVEGMILDPELYPDPVFVMSAKQALEIAGAKKNYISRLRLEYPKRLEALQRLGFSGSAIDVAIQNDAKARRAKAMTVQDVSRLWVHLSSIGLPEATALVSALTEEGIERRFNRAFGIKITEDEYNQKLSVRMARLLARHEWGKVIKDRMTILGYYDSNRERAIEEFRRLTIKVNMHLFGVPHFKCDRDNMTEDQQRLITSFEQFLIYKANKNPNLNHY